MKSISARIARASLVAALSFACLAPISRAVDGVNLQPAYYNGGNVNFAWSLMKSKSNIQRLRIEIDSSRVSTATAKSWIDQAKANGFTNIICTFHQFGGSDNAADLMTAANWWKNNYNALGGGFTINLCNEWSDHNITSSAYASAYNSAIAVVRQVYSGPIVVDIPGWGQETLTALNAYKTSSPTITDGNVIVSTHIYPGNWNQGRNHVYQTSDMNDLSAIGKTVIIGEFGTGTGSCDWSGCVNYGKSLGWSCLAWSWNGDGGALNMVSPSWAQNATATSFATNSYFDTVYPKLGNGGTSSNLIANGTYTIIARNSGMALDDAGSSTANGNQMVQWTVNGGNNQKWQLTNLGNNVVQLVCVASNKALEVPGSSTTAGTIVDQWDVNGGNNQHWKMVSVGSGYYELINVTSNMALDVVGASTTAGAKIDQWTTSGNTNQQWRFQ